MRKIPFVDLYAQYLTIKEEIDEIIARVIRESAYIKGRYVEEFEEAFEKKLGIKNCIGVANGTDALFIAMKMLGIGNGDEVITTAHSWISTSETISLTGAVPVFVDIDTEYYTIDTDLIESKITSKTKAIIPVHLYGQMCEMEKIASICRKHNLFLIEDCAQSHFSRLGDKFAGTFGDVATFSFFPGKNLGAYGDAGAIVTNHDELALKIRRFSNHGAIKKHQHDTEGINSRLDGLQAAILGVKLKHIDSWNLSRNRLAEIYNREINSQGIPIVIPKVRPGTFHSFHLYVVLTKGRDMVLDKLNEYGIASQIHYPLPLPLLPCYHHMNFTPNSFPAVSSVYRDLLSLPLFPEMKEEEVVYVCEKLKEFTS